MRQQRFESLLRVLGVNRAIIKMASPKGVEIEVSTPKTKQSVESLLHSRLPASLQWAVTVDRESLRKLKKYTYLYEA